MRTVLPHVEHENVFSPSEAHVAVVDVLFVLCEIGDVILVAAIFPHETHVSVSTPDFVHDGEISVFFTEAWAHVSL